MYAALRARWSNDYPERWTDHLVEAAIYNERKTDALSSSITLQDWEHARKRWCTDFRFLDVSADLSVICEAMLIPYPQGANVPTVADKLAALDAIYTAIAESVAVISIDLVSGESFPMSKPPADTSENQRDAARLLDELRDQSLESRRRANHQIVQETANRRGVLCSYNTDKILASIAVQFAGPIMELGQGLGGDRAAPMGTELAYQMAQHPALTHLLPPRAPEISSAVLGKLSKQAAQEADRCRSTWTAVARDIRPIVSILNRVRTLVEATSPTPYVPQPENFTTDAQKALKQTSRATTSSSSSASQDGRSSNASGAGSIADSLTSLPFNGDVPSKSDHEHSIDLWRELDTSDDIAACISPQVYEMLKACDEDLMFVLALQRQRLSYVAKDLARVGLTANGGTAAAIGTAHLSKTSSVYNTVHAVPTEMQEAINKEVKSTNQAQKLADDSKGKRKPEGAPQEGRRSRPHRHRGQGGRGRGGQAYQYPSNPRGRGQRGGKAGSRGRGNHRGRGNRGRGRGAGRGSNHDESQE